MRKCPNMLKSLREVQYLAHYNNMPIILMECISGFLDSSGLKETLPFKEISHFFADLEQDGFSKNPFFHAIVAEVPEQHKTKDGETLMWQVVVVRCDCLGLCTHLSNLVVQS